MMKRLMFVGIATTVVLGLGFNAYTDFAPTSSKISPSLRWKLDSQAKVPALVVLKEQADLSGAEQISDVQSKRRFVYDALRSVALRTQDDLVAWLTEKGVKFRRFYIMNMIVVYDAPAEVIKKLAARSDVQKVWANPTVKLDLPLTNPMGIFETPMVVGDNLVSVGAKRVWDEFASKGRGIVVAGQDTGVQWDHPALRKQYRGTQADGSVSHDYNWHDSIHADVSADGNSCGYDTAAPCDDDKHGTHTVGTMVGDDGGENVVGMAPEAKWIACRNMNAGMGTPATYIECFEFFLAPYPHGGNAMLDGDTTKAPDVINNSWGCPESEGCDGGEMLDVVKALSAAGIMVVVSAGNEGPGCSTIKAPPAMYSGDIFSVGAVDHRTGKIASFSSRGPSVFDGRIGPDITAPGVNIRSTVPGSGYAQVMWSGTSMAGPHVAGAVALLWSVRPELYGKIRPTVELLHSTAVPKRTTESCGGVSGNIVPNNTFGYGFLNIFEAVSRAR